MPYIKVDIEKIRQYQQTVENVRAITRSSTEVLSAISGSIDTKLRQTNNIDGQLRRVEEELYSHQRVMAQMSVFLDNARQKYCVLGNYDNVGNADLSTGAVYAVPNVTATVQAQGNAAASSSAASYIYRNDTENQTSAILERKMSNVGDATVVSAAANTISQGEEWKENTGENVKTGNHAVAAAAGVHAVTMLVGTAGIGTAQLDEMDQAQILRIVASRLHVTTENLQKDMEAGAYSLKDITECLEGKATDLNRFVQNAPNAQKWKESAGENAATGNAAVSDAAHAAAMLVGTVGAATAQLDEMDQAQILRTAASKLNVTTEDLLKNIEAGAYSLKDITECLEGKATELNNFVQNAANTLKGLTGSQDIRFEQKDGYWILSGYQRDSWANDLVKQFHDGTGIGSRYKEETLENTPVLGVVFKADQVAETAEKATQVVQKAADIVEKGTTVVLATVEAADKIREHSAVAADKIADVLADDGTSKSEKIAASAAIVGTTVVSTALDVSASHAGNAVSAAVGKLVGDKSGDETLGKEVGKIAGKVVTTGMELVSNVVSSDAVVNQVAESNLEIGNAIQSGGKAIGEAGKSILDAESPGEVLRNVGSFVAVVGNAGKDVVKTTVTETAEVIYTVGKETAIATAEMVGDAVKSGYQTVSQNVKNEYETIKGFKDEVVGGINTVTVLAGEAYSVLKSSDEDISISEAISLAAEELGISKADIHDSINKGLCTTEDIFEYLDGKATEANAFVKQASSILRTISGATDMVFENKDGYIIVSEFTRKGWANTLVKTFNDGTGIGTRYKPETLKDTPVIGTLYKADEAVEVMDKVASGVNAVVTTVSGVVEAGKKINDIWSDDTLTKKEKIYDTAAVAVTSVVGTALDVAAPFAGAAVKTAVTGAISAVLPGVGPVIGNAVGAVAGALVENGMQLVSDVITSEKVVNQVSDSMTEVGDTVAAEAKVVSDAGKKLLESKNAKEALENTAQFVGTAVVSGTKVVATAVTEGAKVAVTVAQETAKAVGEAVVSKAKAVGETAKKVVDTTVEAAKQVGSAVVAGAKAVSDAAKEAAEKAAKSLAEAQEEAKRKAEQLAREAAEKARQAAQKAAEEAARIAAETKRKAEEAARKAAEEAKRKAEEIARQVAEAKRKAEEAARRAAAEAKRRAEEAARKAAEAARKAAEAARKAAEAAKKKAAEAAKKVKKALSKW